MIRIRIVHAPSIAEVDGITLDLFEVGVEYEVGNSVAALLLAEGWAEPVALDAPKPPEPFSREDPFGTTILDSSSPPNLVKEQHPPCVLRDRAHDAAPPWRWRRRKRT